VRVTRGRKIGTGRTWWRAIGWLTAVLVMLLIGAAWGPPTSSDETAGSVKRTGPAVETVATRPVDVTQRGQRAVGVTFPVGDPVAAAIRDGDRVDVTGAFATAPDGQPLARTVLNHVLVIVAARQGAVVALTLSVTPREAEALAFAAANARLSIALCPAGPDTGLPADGVRFDDL
jgi:hypothetical protein